MNERDAEFLMEVLKRSIMPAINTIVDLHLGIIAACNERGSIDTEKLLAVLDEVASLPTEDRIVRAIVERVAGFIAELPPSDP